MEKHIIGIITFHYTTNYGAVLQAFALKKALQELGHEVEIIDYRNSNVSAAMKTYNISDFRNPFNYFRYHRNKNNHQRKIDTFLNFISENLCKLTKPLYQESIASCNDLFDTFICGSDQIWNFDITGFDFTYFLDFVSLDKLKIAYAASLGSSAEKENHVKTIVERLEGFTRTSVREKSSVDLLSSYGCNVELCCDPTLLFNESWWVDLSLDPHILNTGESFVFVYELEKNIGMIDYANQIAKREGFSVVVLAANTNVLYRYRSQNGHIISYCKPEEFVWYLHNANYIITNSFHGVLFSINFSKPFSVFLLKNNFGLNSRLVNLLDCFNLGNRISTDQSPMNLKLEVDYSTIKCDVENYRQISFTFLENSVNRD